MTETSEYQKLRAHLAFLRMAAAAEALPAELDHATKAKLSPLRRSSNGSWPSRSPPSTSAARPA